MLLLREIAALRKAFATGDGRCFAGEVHPRLYRGADYAGGAVYVARRGTADEAVAVLQKGGGTATEICGGTADRQLSANERDAADGRVVPVFQGTGVARRGVGGRYAGDARRVQKGERGRTVAPQGDAGDKTAAKAWGGMERAGGGE